MFFADMNEAAQKCACGQNHRSAGNRAAIGGLGKGHLVREIDALDGLMGHVADKGGIQFRVLNRRKGPAVRGPRAQADRKLYAQAMQAAICATPNLQVIETEADDLMIEPDGRRVPTVAIQAEAAKELVKRLREEARVL